MSRTLSHELQPAKRHDDAARQRFILSLKGHVSRHIRPVNRELFDRDVAPAFEAAHGRPPRTRDEIREKMNDKPIYQTWGGLQRCSQDETWMSMLDMIEADYDRMTDAANRLGSAPDKRGSLDIPDDFKVPADLLKAKIHGQPGG